MHALTVQQLHEILGGQLRLAALLPLHGDATPVGPIVADSRQVRPGEVFWALNGTRFDGASFTAEAFERGASGVVSPKYVAPANRCWSLQVPDTAESLWKLAEWNRTRTTGKVITVTGSVGKTTTRHMIRAVLETRLQGTTSPKNYNNHIGVPLSMLAMRPADDFAVLELAASAPGEIGPLAHLCRPNIGVITRVGDAHLGGFGSLEAVAEAKGELLPALPADGWAVLNGDNRRLRKQASRTSAKIVWCGRGLDNDLVATHVECAGGRLSFVVGNARMSLAAWGRHHLAGALAAVAVGRICGLTDVEIARGLDAFQPPPMRCQITRVGDATVIDDTYNASPMAMKAALELLRDFDAPGRRIVICGDMRELGDAADELHRALGNQVVTLCGADLLLACGEHAAAVVAGAREAGMPSNCAVSCREPDELAARDETTLAAGDVVLIKGSRAMALDRLVATLQTRAAAAA